MKLDKLQIENFIGLKRLVIDDIKGVTLIHGPNKSGKTTIREAIKMALIGSVERVSRVADYPELIYQDEKKAIIAAGFTDGTEIKNTVISIDREGNHHGIPKGDFDDEWPLILTQGHFSSSSVAHRKKVIFKLNRVSFTQDKIYDMLEQKGADMILVDELGAMLASGFQNCEAECEDRAREQRAIWVNLTGRKRYGEIIADTWAFEKEQLNESSSVLQDMIDEKTEERAKHQAVIDQSKAYHDYERRYKNKLADLRDKAGKREQYEVKVDEYKSELDRHAMALAEKQKALTPLGENFMRCPQCNASLMLGDDLKLLPINAKVMTVAARKKATAEVAELKKVIKACELSVTTVHRLVEGARDAAVELKAITDMEPPPEVEGRKVEIAKGKSTELDADLDGLRQRRNLVVDIEHRNANADAVTNSAMAAHNKVKSWLKLKDLFSPSGLPAQLIERVLRPFNDRLLAVHYLTDWPRVEISEDMSIHVGGRAYALLSESEKWCCDAQIAEAVSFISGVQMVFLDRMDILDMPARGELIKWCLALAEDNIQCFVFATLKKPYEIPGIKSVWLG